MFITALLIHLMAHRAAGHAQLFEPPPRTTQGILVGSPNCAGGTCLWFIDGSFIGCDKAVGSTTPGLPRCIPFEPSIPANDEEHGTIFTKMENVDAFFKPLVSKFPNNDWTAYHPWRRPGIAPIENSCGLNGGWYHSGAAGTGGEAMFGLPQGMKGTNVAPLLKQTTWIAGSVTEVAWGIMANHGGGYQYRLCRVTDRNNIGKEATEECFQKNVLEFLGDKQWLQFGGGMDTKNRTEVSAVHITDDRGKVWRRNPVPGCNDVPRLGGHNHACKGPMFRPPIPNVYGFGPGACASGDVNSTPCTEEEIGERAMDFTIVDKVKVPDLPPGDYVLSWRWECEQLPQVWLNCADIKIRKKGTAKATKPFSSFSGCETCCKETQGVCSNCTACYSENRRDGDCAYCWKPLKGFNFGYVPQFHCLGFEGPDGGPKLWKPGMPWKGEGWSPGCPRCWSSPENCQASDREGGADTDYDLSDWPPAPAPPIPHQHNTGMITKKFAYMTRADAHDTIQVYQHLSPVYLEKYGTLLGKLGVFHSSIGFYNERTGLNSTMDFLGNTAKPVWAPERLYPQLNRSTHTMEWLPSALGVKRGGEGVLDLSYWLFHSKLATINGGTYNKLLDWADNINFDHYYVFNLISAGEIQQFDANTCYKWNEMVVEEINRIAGPTVFSSTSSGLYYNDLDLLATSPAIELPEGLAFLFTSQLKKEDHQVKQRNMTSQEMTGQLTELVWSTLKAPPPTTPPIAVNLVRQLLGSDLQSADGWSVYSYWTGSEFAYYAFEFAEGRLNFSSYWKPLPTVMSTQLAGSLVGSSLSSISPYVIAFIVSGLLVIGLMTVCRHERKDVSKHYQQHRVSVDGIPETLHTKYQQLA